MSSLKVSLILFWILYLPFQVLAVGSTTDYLQRLDSVVDHIEVYYAAKREQLAGMQLGGKGIASDSARYQHNAELYNECFTFDSKLAMHVAKENQQIAERLRDQDGVYEWRIKESFLLASTGQLLEAVLAVEDIRSSDLSHQLKLDYFGQMQYLYSHLNQYTWDDELKTEYENLNKAYNDSICLLSVPSDPDYDWFMAWEDLKNGKAKASVVQLQPRVDTLALDSRQDAMLSYLLARLYESLGDQDNYIKYMTKSAIADVRSANLDIASLEELASVLFGQGDLDHSYKYINVCMKTARMYNNQVRMVNVARLMDQILTAYQERDLAQRQRLNRLIWWLIAAIVALVGVVVLVVRQHKRLQEEGRRDFLTGIPNRLGGTIEVGAMLEHHTQCYFCILDVDKFKYVNDTFGHAAGDELLVGIAQALSGVFSRKQVMRLGGDEFAFFDAQSQSEEVFGARIELLFRKISAIRLKDAPDYVPSVSVGADHYDGTKDCSFDHLYASSDQALYVSKERTGCALTLA